VWLWRTAIGALLLLPLALLCAVQNHPVLALLCVVTAIPAIVLCAVAEPGWANPNRVPK
jgi:hypothetical protein